MHIGNAGGLLQGYDRAETTVNNAIGGLTGPLTEAYGLLAYTPHPNAHPRVQLTDIASGLGKDQVDLAWRRDWISSHDGVDVPATLGDAIAQLGLTGSDALKAEIATLNGGDLSDVVAKALQARKAEADAERLTELNELIDDWNGSDNDPLLDDLLRERRNIIRAYVSGDAPVPEAIAAAFFKTSADEGGPVLLDDLKDLWDQIPNKDLIAVAALLMLSGNREPEEQVEERSLWGSFRHNFVDGNSVIGSLARGRLSPQAAATIAQNAPDVIDTLDNAFSEISSLNPASIEGITLLLENPEQFVDNYINFAGGVGEWAVDTGTMAGALIIAGNPGLNAAYAQQTGTNVQQEVINALKSTATLAIEDPDAFAAIAVDWEGLEDDPIRWFATQTPDIVIEVLTAGAAGGAIATRRGANVAGDLTGAIDDLPPPTWRQSGAGSSLGEADEAYDLIRANPGDVDSIARNTDFTVDEIADIKNHLFEQVHLLDRYEDYGVPPEWRRFDSDPGIAEAWQRLEAGNPRPEDIELLNHELTELTYMRDTGNPSYREAHEYAESIHPAPQYGDS